VAGDTIAPVRMPSVLAGAVAALLSVAGGARAQPARDAMPSFAMLEGAPARLLAPDGDSISCGAANRGALANSRALRDRGDGFVIPEPWRARDRRYGTRELVGLIERAAAAVAAEHPGSVLGVADLSRRDGGAATGHRSHQSGRDVDLLFYAVDAAGAPLVPDEHMPYYTRARRAYYARSPTFTRDIGERFFDAARTWTLVKAMIADPVVQVERIFVSPRIERWLIEHARARGEDPALVERAQRILHRPGRGESHNDHMHVRIGCSADDIAHGRCSSDPAPRRRRRRWSRAVACPTVPRSEAAAATDVAAVTTPAPAEDAAGSVNIPAEGGVNVNVRIDGLTVPVRLP
jgi:penicillin-insensitive murein endopeptidase